MTTKTKPKWTPDESAGLYGIRNWGAGFFDLNENGEVIVKAPFATGDIAVPITEIVAGLEQRGYAMPLLLRIENILDARIVTLNETFRSVLATCGYSGHYRGVYPVKVNQQCHVIEEITRFGTRYGHGLEAGSKAEMILALASLQNGGLLILNGYKDEEFIDLGLSAIRLGISCFYVIESLNELPIIIERSKALGVRPMIGVRVKVSAKVAGQWTETTGDRSSFGLSTAQLVAVIDTLRQHDMLDCLQLLHCHLGSQIPDIADIRAGVQEAARFYAGLVEEGAAMGYLDLGGGLAVDYTGANARQPSSRNYSLEDYVRAIADTVRTALDPLEVRHPHIVTESGRATVAHSSILLFDVLDVQKFEPVSLPEALPEGVHPLILRLFELYTGPLTNTPESAYNEALACRDAVRALFRSGRVPLRHRSISENLFLAVSQLVLKQFRRKSELPVALAGVRESLADIYYCNFSVFQSLPDTWAINQIFPIIPIHRLDEKPSREAILSDLTCDCDGKIDHFITGRGERPTLPVHDLRDNEDYLLGAFLVGAYQETLGDLHNLFGDTNVVSVRINQDGSFDVMKEMAGDSIAEVVSYVEYNPQTLFETFRARVEEAVRQKQISVKDRQRIVDEYSASLQGYTYYEK